MAGKNPDAPGVASLGAVRGVLFVDYFDFIGVDLTGAVAHMQVRLYGDAPGAALIDFANASWPFTGSPVAVVGVQVDLTGLIPKSRVWIQAHRDTITNLLPYPANGTEQGQPVRLAYDLMIAPQGDPAAQWMAGDFFILPGVTKP